MWRYTVFLAYLFQVVLGVSELCGNRTEQKTLSCTTQIKYLTQIGIPRQCAKKTSSITTLNNNIDSLSEICPSLPILGQHETDRTLCKMYSPNSEECGMMDFGAFSPNTHIGGVILKPYIMPVLNRNRAAFPILLNYTVLNITFSNIKWKTMKLRFQDKSKDNEKYARYEKRKHNHCENIFLSNDVDVDDKSVLYYDCYWTTTDDRDGQSHTLDFEASDDTTVNRGQYIFNIPSAEMLGPSVTEETWKPFIYVEILLSDVRLHIMPPPAHLKITDYLIKVIKGEKELSVKTSATLSVKNNTEEVLYDYKILGENGIYKFLVQPIHEQCKETGNCRVVASPKIYISSETHTLDICIASITALIVATLFAYYIALRLIRKYWCKDYKLAMDHEMNLPQTKVLVIYSTENRLHASCVASFVNYLRSEYSLDVMFDGDIAATSHGDPYIWATEAFRLATHVMNVVGPTQESNFYNSIYDRPIITPHTNVDTLLLSFVKSSRASRTNKEFFNVFFEHSKGQVPIETRHDKVFFLLKDWQKLISYLSKNLVAKRHIMRTERGRCFLEELSRAKEMLNAKKGDVVVRCEMANVFEKKILL